MNKIRPLIRWAGGKVWLTDFLQNHVPAYFGNYHEPFLGGGSVFLALKSSGKINNLAFLSDANKDLIETFTVIRDHPIELIDEMVPFQNTKEFYYSLRGNIPDTSISRAARFLFLNRTSFNGIYRVNLKGEYNVPYGFRKMEYLFKEDEIHALSEALKDTFLRATDFDHTITNIKPGDLVFLDPPYTVAHENNGFVKYNQKIFAWEDQQRLRTYIDKIIEIGAHFILTNAAHISISELYDGVGNSLKLARPSLIGGKGAKRSVYHEILFSNI
ncbi:DNA adenine methylase [Dyadobacter endophyticus]|uniref:DNA adenine methylase n=1 Tax=Dyadobacter endophyticus TaxID=1749036 RepID=UPI003CFB4055